MRRNLNDKLPASLRPRVLCELNAKNRFRIIQNCGAAKFSDREGIKLLATDNCIDFGIILAVEQRNEQV